MLIMTLSQDSRSVPEYQGQATQPIWIQESGVKYKVHQVHSCNSCNTWEEKAGIIRWGVYAAYGVHQDTKNHYGGMMYLGNGFMHIKSSKQKLNTQSSTEAQIVDTNDHIYSILWSMQFLESQGYGLK